MVEANALPYRSAEIMKLAKFEAQFGDRELNSLTTDEVWGFLAQQTDGTSPGNPHRIHSSNGSIASTGKKCWICTSSGATRR